MFTMGFVGDIQGGVKQIQEADNAGDFQRAVGQLCDYLQKRKYDSKSIQELERRAYFMVNEYSERDTCDKLAEAKKRVVDYIDNMMTERTDSGDLLKVLNNFPLFLAGMFENEPHKSCTFQKQDLEKIKIQNEYDLQFVLYAYLRPLYPTIRAEVSEDIGYAGPVRPDFVISPECALEVKYTRKTMSIRDLKEQIAADITHYKEKEIYFFIYDKEKMIDSPEAFREAYESKGGDKDIHIVIQQPILL